jgi:hypothetical protein
MPYTVLGVIVRLRNRPGSGVRDKNRTPLINNPRRVSFHEFSLHIECGVQVIDQVVEYVTSSVQFPVPNAVPEK